MAIPQAAVDRLKDQIKVDRAKVAMAGVQYLLRTANGTATKLLTDAVRGIDTGELCEVSASAVFGAAVKQV